MIHGDKLNLHFMKLLLPLILLLLWISEIDLAEISQANQTGGLYHKMHFSDAKFELFDRSNIQCDDPLATTRMRVSHRKASFRDKLSQNRGISRAVGLKLIFQDN